MPDALILLFPRTTNGRWLEGLVDFSLEDLGGHIPNVGDNTISPCVLRGRNRIDPSQRTFFEVKRRSFLPTYQEDGMPRGALEVLERTGKPHEVAIL